MQAQLIEAFTDYIWNEYNTWQETDYDNYYFAGDDFSGYKSLENEIIDKCFAEELDDDVFSWLENGCLIFDRNKVYNLYKSGDIEINDSEAEKAIEEGEVDTDEIINYLCTGDFTDDSDYDSYGPAYDYAINGGWKDVLDMDDVYNFVDNNINIMHIGDLWFFQLDGDGHLWDEDDYQFTEVFGELLDDLQSETAISPEEVPDLDDETGDTTYINYRIDYDNRDYAGIYVGNGEFIFGDNGETHTEMLQAWLDEKANEDEEEQMELSSKWHRVDADEVQEATGGECIAFCHVIGDCFFVDADSEMLNCDAEEVVDAAMKTGRFDKGYIYHSWDNTIYREARKHLVTKEILRLQQKLGKRVYVAQIR